MVCPDDTELFMTFTTVAFIYLPMKYLFKPQYYRQLNSWKTSRVLVGNLKEMRDAAGCTKKNLSSCFVMVKSMETVHLFFGELMQREI